MQYTAIQEIDWMSGSGINGQPVDDQQILKRIAVGDRQALSELYVRYQRPLFNYLLQLTLAIPLALETFAAIVLPGILFIAAFSIACPAILWVPLYQFLYVGYWFWGNWLSPRFGIPTLSNTILTPGGGYISAGFFGEDSIHGLQATPLQGVESMLLLLCIAIFVTLVLWSYLKWQQARQ
ncbi:MAG: hypothetical protein ACJ8CB_04530 [Ktedonobacteraceae bacterium]